MGKAQETFYYKDKPYPDYIRKGNAIKHILPFAKHFCKGRGLDIGGTPDWCYPNATPINPEYFDNSASNILNEQYDFIFSSHCLEHLPNYIESLELWRECLKPDGQLFLYLPHPDMQYWRPQNCRKHLHEFQPLQMESILSDLGFTDIFFSERDMYWSFAITGVKYEI